MRACVANRRGLDALELREIDKPKLRGAEEVLVRVRAAAVNPADYKVVTGASGSGFLHASRFPLVAGYDFSGEIEEVGEGVSGVAKGDEVFGFLPYSRKNDQGSFAEYVVVPDQTVAKKPTEATHVEAACAATVASTALQGLRDKGDLKPGQHVLVNGASGGVGSYAIQIAKNLGATVWGTSSTSKMAFVEELGADRVFDYRETSLGDLDQQFDVVLDAASKSSYSDCLPILGDRGRYVTLLPSLGFFSGVLRALFSRRACRTVLVKSRRADLDQIAEWTAAGDVRHSVDSTYPLSELHKALRRLHSGKVQGKIAIAIDE